MPASATHEYFQRTQFLYNLLWSKLALSYGLWVPGTKSVAEAIERQFQFVQNTLGLTADDQVLDLGSGTGGCAIRLAQLTNCRVTGLTLSEKQITQANRLAQRVGVDQLVSFQRIDFEQPLPFSAGTFSRVYSIEALCYAVNKKAVLAEIWRLLKPGGKFLCLDGFLRTGKLSPPEWSSYQTCLSGWRVPGLATKDEFLRSLWSVGFNSVRYQEKTNLVIPSSQRIHQLGLWLWPVTSLLSTLRLIPRSLHQNTLTMIEQRQAFKTFAEYGIVTGTK